MTFRESLGRGYDPCEGSRILYRLARRITEAVAA